MTTIIGPQSEWGWTACERIALAALVCLVTNGCMTQPFDGQAIKARSTKIGMSGSVPIASDLITLQARNASSNTWSTMTTTRSETVGSVDPKGTTWHMWGVSNVPLPSSTSFWTSRGSGSSRFVDIDVRATSSNYGDLETFTSAASDCLINTAFSGGGGFDFISQCGTGTQARVRVPCGDRSEVCCTSRTQSNFCNSGSVCKTGLCVAPAVVVKPPTSASGGMPMMDVPGSMAAGATCADMAGGPCMGSTGCLAGVTSVPGVVRCSGNTPRCEVAADSFCSICGGACGGCATESCQFDEHCGPGSVCQTSAALPHVCRPIEPSACHHINGYCWLPKESLTAAPPPGARNQDICVEGQ